MYVIPTLKMIYELLKLSTLVLTEIFTAKKRAREANEKFEMDQVQFWKMVDLATEKMLDESEKDSKKAKKVEDQIDAEYNKK